MKKSPAVLAAGDFSGSPANMGLRRAPETKNGEKNHPLSLQGRLAGLLSHDGLDPFDFFLEL